ncbi:O-glucosyltransferase rumi homolog [Linum perenne]
MQLTLQRWWHGSAAHRHLLIETIHRPLMKLPPRSSAVVFSLLFLIGGAFISTRLLDSNAFTVSGGSKVEVSKSSPTTSLTASPEIPKQPLRRIEVPLNCTALNHTITCPTDYLTGGAIQDDESPPSTCPEYFRWIHEDLRPWARTGITRQTMESAKRTANFKLVIVNGKAYVEKYQRVFQTRDVFTIWGIVQLLRKYPGKVPDLELMFDCVDWPVVKSVNYDKPNATAPPPLFRYCGDDQTLDIVFPDWSFWGWPEVNIKPWEELQSELREGNQRSKWMNREPYAYWKGNPAVAETRMDLMKCNLSEEHDWNARVFAQDWIKESQQGYKQSDLASQCVHRYKIYIEGSAWSVSQKYIMACDSVTLLVKPHYYDFFTRSLVPVHHYWPIQEHDKCKSIKFAVDWGNNHKHKAQEIGKAASSFIQDDLRMDYVYDYMLHLLTEYSKLLTFKPVVPRGAVELCAEAMACKAKGLKKKFMMESMVKGPSETSPCSIPPPYDPASFSSILRRKSNSIKQVESWEKGYWENQMANPGMSSPHATTQPTSSTEEFCSAVSSVYMQLTLQRWWHGSAAHRHLLIETIRRPLMKLPPRSSAVVFSLLFLIGGAFISTRLLDSNAFTVSGGSKVEVSKSSPTTSLAASPEIPKQPLRRIEVPLNCTALNHTRTCPTDYLTVGAVQDDESPPSTCPEYFRWIHEDLRPWARTGITRQTMESAKRTANFKLVIVNGKAYVEKYQRAFQTRDVFTIWGIVQLLRKYPGKVPDLELMFDCVDWPVVRSDDYDKPNATAPPPLFRYCGDDQTLDIVFPDWSFWGWPEVNIKPWEELQSELREGNQRSKWMNREPYAYWKGNPTVAETRMDLMKCNLSEEHDWNARVFAQDWIKESQQGYKQSDLASQCVHRYKIYIEGSAWSVSQKYIMACDSVTLLVKPHYYDFFTRSLVPVHHYWPIQEHDKCKSIKFAVDWGNNHKHKAQEIGKAASSFIQEELRMDYVYDYMLHLLTEYSKLLTFKPVVPRGAVELCAEAMACKAEGLEKKFMMESMVKGPSETSPCSIPPPYDPASFSSILRRKSNSIKQVESWEKGYWENQSKQQA